MPWWAWIIGGIVLVGVELLGADLAFYLAFMGLAAILVGVFEAAGPGLPAWGQWLLYAFLAVTSMLLFRDELYRRLRGGLPGFKGSNEGAIVDVNEDLSQGGRTRVALRGTEWDAMNVGSTAIAAGEKGRVVRMAGTELHIESVSEAQALNAERD